MVLELTVVDAFTAEPFKGNPAAVAVLEAFADDASMQASERGGTVRMRLGGARVTIAGQAVKVARTQLLVWP